MSANTLYCTGTLKLRAIYFIFHKRSTVLPRLCICKYIVLKTRSNILKTYCPSINKHETEFAG